MVRLPPSPTGPFHIGNARALLFNFLFARQHGGRIIFRSEDTDKERSRKEYEDDIMSGLRWLGISWDSFYRQSERTAIYTEHLHAMIASGAAYASEEIPVKKGARTTVIRFKNPGTIIRFHDHIRGNIEFDTTELGDFVIAKDMETPLYHLAVVVDDFLMGVTHVIRGEDGISNTPRQILIQEAIGAPRPQYAHLPLVLGHDKSKLSKRKHGKEVSVTEYRAQGYLPEAIVNFLALLGWSPQSGGESTSDDVLTLDELIKKFSLEKVQKSGAIFNIEKLKSLNKAHMLRLPPRALQEGILAFMPESLRQSIALQPDVFNRALPQIVERIRVFGDVAHVAADGEFSFYFMRPDYPEPEELIWKKGQQTVEKTIEHLERVQSLVAPSADGTQEHMISAVRAYAEGEGRGAVLWPLRYALSGRAQSPDPFTIAGIIGKEETLKRIEQAISTLYRYQISTQGDTR